MQLEFASSKKILDGFFGLSSFFTESLLWLLICLSELSAMKQGKMER